MPKASALRFHQSNGSRLNGAPLALRKQSRVLRHRRAPPIAAEPTPSPRLWATPPGATPAGLCEHTMGADCQPSKPELSTWPGIGTFYLAPTGDLLDMLLSRYAQRWHLLLRLEN